MSTPDGPDRPSDEPTPPSWDAPPQPPAWDRPAGPPQGGTEPFGQPSYGQPSYGQPSYGSQAPGAPQAWGPPPGYGPQGPGGYGAAPITDTKAVVALVLAIGSFVVCPVVPAIVALVLAGSSQSAIDASGGRLSGTGLNKAAKIVSWIHLGLVALGVVAFVLLVVVAGASTTA